MPVTLEARAQKAKKASNGSPVDRWRHLAARGETETGGWAIGNLASNAGRGEYIALSFPIRLKESLSAADVHYRPASFPPVKGCSEELKGVPLEECEKEVKEEAHAEGNRSSVPRQRRRTEGHSRQSVCI